MKTINLQTEASRCVRCGHCLIHCPTYQLTQDEGDSPRGRISLISAYASDKLSAHDISNHINRCLLCTACENVCPSEVNYYDLITHTKQQLFQQLPFHKRLFKTCVSNSITALAKSSRLRRLIIRYSNSRLRWLTAHVMGQKLARLDNLLPALPHEISLQSSSKQGIPIGLLTGCASRLIEQSLLSKIQQLLESLGYQVVIPEQQVCCGALDYHSGNITKGLSYLSHNQALFRHKNVNIILSAASGCGSFAHQHANDDISFIDINQFIHQQVDWSQYTYQPLDKTVAIHTPCSLQQAYGNAQSPFDFLSHIPHIQLDFLADNPMCCGAAGNYMIEQGTMADALVDNKIRALQQSGADILLTSNVGCSLHLTAAIKRHGVTIQVMHPVELLIQQLYCMD